ncbi:hypothetical protein PSAC2689_10134 [Paraburkholderia sacchari]
MPKATWLQLHCRVRQAFILGALLPDLARDRSLPKPHRINDVAATFGVSRLSTGWSENIH